VSSDRPVICLGRSDVPKALALKVNGWSLVLFLCLQTKLKSCSSSPLVVGVGFYQKVAGSLMKRLRPMLLAVKPGRKRVSSARSRPILVTFWTAVLLRNSPSMHQKQATNSSNASSRRRRRSGRRCTREIDSGLDMHRPFRL
jgi:hypothetical protein